jgi:hypothetical protein
MARKFFYVCAGLFLLALTYHFGASTATAQAPANPVAAASGGTIGTWVFTSNGDAYQALDDAGTITFVPRGNVFAIAKAHTKGADTK